MILIRRKNKVIQDFESCEHKDYKRNLNACDDSVKSVRHERPSGRFWKSQCLAASVSFLPLPHPLFLIFALAPFFARAKRRKPRFFALCSTETLATQASWTAALHLIFQVLCKTYLKDPETPVGWGGNREKLVGGLRPASQNSDPHDRSWRFSTSYLWPDSGSIPCFRPALLCSTPVENAS